MATFKLSRKDILFISIIALVHMVFFVLACGYKRIYMGDSFEYIYEALNVKRYFFFYSGNPAMPIEPEYMSQRQPLYPLMLLGVYVFTVNNWVVLVLQNLLSVFNIFYTRSVLTRIGYKERYDLLLLLFICAYPAQFINANTIAPDILLQTFSILYFGSFIALIQMNQQRYMVRMSIFLVAGLLVKPVLYPFVVIHFFIIVIVAVLQKSKMQRPLLIALSPLFAVMLYDYWNYTRTEKFHFSSNQAFNAIYYFHAYIAQKEDADSADRFLLAERKYMASIPQYKDRYDYANERGMQLLLQNFLPYMIFHLKNTARIFIEPGKGEMDLFTGWLTYGKLYSKQQTGFYATLKNKGLRGLNNYLRTNPSMPFVIIVLLFNFIRLIGLGWFFFSKGIHWSIRSFVFIFVGYFALAAGPIANTRYFLPVSLILIGCAVVGFMEMKQKATISN